MNKKKILLSWLMLCLLATASWSMIDSYFFKLKGEILSVASQTIESEAGAYVNYSMEIKIIDILPNENAADVSRAKTRFRDKINVQSVRAVDHIDLSALKPGDVILGDFEQMEVEMHPAGGYRVTNSMLVEERVCTFSVLNLLLAPFVFLINLLF